jgi:hypothetical protein
MANRAYLFSGDRDDPEVWHRHNDIYYDSRWTVPLSWWFFFRVPDIRLVNIQYGESSWHEVKFVADKAKALAAFAERRELLSSLTKTPDGEEVITHFLDTVRAWPGTYLLMDPEEAFTGGGEPEEGHQLRCVRILAALEDVAEALSPYSCVRVHIRVTEIQRALELTGRSGLLRMLVSKGE